MDNAEIRLEVLRAVLGYLRNSEDDRLSATKVVTYANKVAGWVLEEGK